SRGLARLRHGEPVQSKRRLGRRWRSDQPAELGMGRRRLQIHRRRQDVDEHGAQGYGTRRAHRSASDEPGHRLRRRARPSLGRQRWQKLTNGLPSGEMGRIGISIYRKDPRVVYVSVEQGLRYNASTAYEQRSGGVYRSDDKGASFKFMSDWNPRPTYSSQIRV